MTGSSIPSASIPSTAGRSFLDLHCHSSASFDSLASPQSLIAKARRIGLTHLAITDHERVDVALRARDLAPADLVVIVGEEVRSADGDLIGLFLERAVPPGLSAAETAAAIHEQGGIVGLPHPFDRFRSSGGSKAAEQERALAALAAAVDYVEVHNARAYRDANPRAAAFAQAHGLPGTASSDAHSVMELGVASTVVPADVTDGASLLAALADARLMTSRASYLVRGWTPVAKVIQRVRGNRRIVPGMSMTTTAVDA
ncbi:MAG: PHP domain-containing protein [Chloroflexi bacterium]|nr:PHP domain-containing protein [Chloroflexota bacterium]